MVGKRGTHQLAIILIAACVSESVGWAVPCSQGVLEMKCSGSKGRASTGSGTQEEGTVTSRRGEAHEEEELLLHRLHLDSTRPSTRLCFTSHPRCHHPPQVSKKSHLPHAHSHPTVVHSIFLRFRRVRSRAPCPYHCSAIPECRCCTCCRHRFRAEIWRWCTEGWGGEPEKVYQDRLWAQVLRHARGGGGRHLKGMQGNTMSPLLQSATSPRLNTQIHLQRDSRTSKQSPCSPKGGAEQHAPAPSSPGCIFRPGQFPLFRPLGRAKWQAVRRHGTPPNSPPVGNSPVSRDECVAIALSSDMNRSATVSWGASACDIGAGPAHRRAGGGFGGHEGGWFAPDPDTFSSWIHRQVPSKTQNPRFRQEDVLEHIVCSVAWMRERESLSTRVRCKGRVEEDV
jgi:hypothetical protein